MIKELKYISFISLLYLGFGCSSQYPLTSFYVKNTSSKVINFKVSVVKQSSMGSSEFMLPFTLLPKDSLLMRRIGVKKEALPTVWFSKFVIFPTDSIVFNDAYKSENWHKSYDAKGNPVYTFIITKNE